MYIIIVPGLYHSGGGLVAKSCPTLATPWKVASQVPLSMGVFRQEYWNGLPFTFPKDLPNPRIEPTPPAPPSWQVDSITNHKFALK